MTHIEEALQQLKGAIIDMAALSIAQLQKSKEAYMNMDSEIAEEVIHSEKRVNAVELSIDRDCGDILALLNPVASDLRFVIAMLKINSELERIGDYADGISKYVILFNRPVNSELIEATKLGEMFGIAISMATDILTAIENEDNKLARKVYKKDAKLNKINKGASTIISGFVKKDPDIIKESLFLFSTIRKIERVGDHIKNIAEELIFYLEVEVLKHKRKR